MATSGNYTLSLTLNELAEEVLDILQATGDGESLDGDLVSRVRKTANLLLKEWQSQGIHLWTQTEGTLFLKVGQEKYDFRDSTTHVSNNWYETTTTANTAAGAYKFNVVSATNILPGDTIGIIQSDNDLFWTTVTFKSGLEITVKDRITKTTSSGTYVRNYRDTLIPISKVTDVRRKEGSDYEITINLESRQNYFGLPNKNQTGTPIQAYYDRQDLAGQKYGVMYLWNAPSSSVPVINFTYERKMQLLVNGADTVDIPEYAQKAFIYNVADNVALKIGCSSERMAIIKNEAMILKEQMLAFDSESFPIKVRMKRNA